MGYVWPNVVFVSNHVDSKVGVDTLICPTLAPVVVRKGSNPTHQLGGKFLNLERQTLRLPNIYASNDAKERTTFYTFMVDELLKAHWLVCEDFGKVRTRDDKECVFLVQNPSR